MNTLKYKLEIIGENTNYTPRKEIIDPIVSSDKKIFEITADNSYGKTFILNLIAYALDADKLDSDRILPAIKDSIARYDDQNSYNLDYNIDLVLPDNKELSLSKEKGRGKLIQINGGAPISHNLLHKDLSVIYDVPSNPSERLNAVIKDLGIWNNNLMTKFNKISRYLNDVTKQFDSVRDEDKIAHYKSKSQKYEIDITEKVSELNSKKETLKELTTLINLDQLSNYLTVKLKTESDIFKLTATFKQLKKPQKIEKKDELKIKQYTTELNQIEINFRNLIAKLIKFINKDIEISEMINEDITSFRHYNNIKEKKIKEIFLSENYISEQDQFMKSIDYLKEGILLFIEKKKNDKSYIIHNSYKEFITLLESLMENNIDHLLKSATTVDTNKLKTQLEAIINEHKIKNYDEVKNFFRNDLKPLKSYLSQYYRTNNQLIKESEKKFVSNNESKYYEVEAKLREKKARLKKVKGLITASTVNCSNEMEIRDLSRFDTSGKITDLRYIVEKRVSNSKLTDNLQEAKENITRDINTLKKIKGNLEVEKKMNDRIFTKEDSKNSSIFNDQQKKRIKLFERMISRIIANTSQFKEMISEIKTGDLSKFKDKEDIQFIDIAGKIIAYSMDNKLLRADGEFVELISYDMVKQEFHCSDNLIIKKEDVSTGLASANYLKQRIENVEGKYVVVLLDEIGNMAQNALDKVIDSIKKLEEQNRLVLAVFTRPNSNGIKIINY
jgi:hypothetical protein